jgi:hypothetical protein
MKTPNPKRRKSKTKCDKCKLAHGGDWMACFACKAWFHKECTGLPDETYIELSLAEEAIWMCPDCLPNLLRYLPKEAPCSCTNVEAAVNSIADTVRTVCKEYESALTSCQQSISQYHTNIRILEKKLAGPLDSTPVASVSSPVQQHAQLIDPAAPIPSKPVNDAEVSRDANRSRVIITNVPLVRKGHLADHIIKLAQFIGLELRYSDIESCNQLAGAHPSNASPIFVRFASGCMRDAFYDRYRHLVLQRRLAVADVFPQWKDDLRRIYVAEHLTPADNIIYKEARRMKKQNVIDGTFTKNGLVHIVSPGSTRGRPIYNITDLLAVTVPINPTEANDVTINPTEANDDTFVSCNESINQSIN